MVVDVLASNSQTSIYMTENGSTGASKEPTRPRARNFWVLDWLRFLLAVYLVLFHTLRISYSSVDGTWIDAVLGMGNAATSIFFVLSGFLLTHAYVVSKNGHPLDRRKFFIARFSTLYPLHVVALLLAMGPVLVTIYTRGGVSVPVIPSGPPQRMLSHAEFMSSLLSTVALLNAWNPYYLSVNIPSWSLSALAFFYLVFPFVAPRVYRAKSPALLLIAMAILFTLPGLIADLLHRTDMFTYGLLHRNPVLRLPLFIAGIALCVLFSRSSLDDSRSKTPIVVLVVVATLVVGALLQYQQVHWHIVKNGLYFPAALAVIWLCICAHPIEAGRLSRWGARLGAASLPLFFLHWPIFTLFSKLEKVVVAVISNSAWSISSVRQIEPSLALYSLYLAILIVVCVLVQERFVLPVQARIRNYVNDRDARALVADERISAG